MTVEYVYAPEIEEELDLSGVIRDANEGRMNRIAKYRKHAGIDENFEITEDNIDEYAFARTVNECNVRSDRLKAELLGQKWSEYEN